MEKVIRLTESDLLNIVNKSLSKLTEASEKGYITFSEVQGLLDSGKSPEDVFDVVDGFKEGLARVKLDNKYNFINSNGKLISNEWFDEAFYYIHNKVKLNDSWYNIDTKGNLYDENRNLIKKNEMNENKKNITEKAIRLTESQFYNLIEDTIKKVMEGDEDDTISIDEEKITFDGDEDDDEVRFEPIKKFQKGPRKMKRE